MILYYDMMIDIISSIDEYHYHFVRHLQLLYSNIKYEVDGSRCPLGIQWWCTIKNDPLKHEIEQKEN